MDDLGAARDIARIDEDLPAYGETGEAVIRGAYLDRHTCGAHDDRLPRHTAADQATFEDPTAPGSDYVDGAL